MKNRLPRVRTRRLAWGAAAIVAAGAALTVTQAFASGPSNTVYACVAKGSGTVQLVAQGVTCRPGEYATSWSVTGPQGLQGAPGVTGPAGPQGQAGAAAPNPTPRAKVVGSVTLTPATGDTTPITFDIYDFSSESQQTADTGSQSTGAGAGKVTFQPVTMTKLPDASSPQLLAMLGAGDDFSTAEVQLYGKDGTVAETFDYKLVALSSMTTTNSGAATDSLFEQLTFEVGAITDTVGSSTGGWNRVTNTPTS
jgi:type VI protein secretion system component Hcp